MEPSTDIENIHTMRVQLQQEHNRLRSHHNTIVNAREHTVDVCNDIFTLCGIDYDDSEQ